MSRRGDIPKRVPTPDPRYGDEKVARFINVIMRDGKKSIAQAVVYGAFDLIAEKQKGDVLMLFKQAIENVSPTVEVKSRRVGGATYQVPIEVRADRCLALSMRWLKDAAVKRGEHTMRRKLAAELMDAAAERGSAYKKREDTHRMAKANSAFAHYRW